MTPALERKLRGVTPAPELARVGRGCAISRIGLALMMALLLGGCAAAEKKATTSASADSSSAAAGAGSSGSMAGMDMGASSTGASVAAGGASATAIKPVPMQMLGTATWQGMKITAQAMTAVPFVVYNGSSEQTVKPGSTTSLHLMVMLNDAYTNVPIPYAGVWATITKDGKIVFDQRQWPMISRYMGPHYGNDVSLPGAGTYQLSLLISPPVSARHMEYENVWLKPHRVTFTFPWKPAS
jgi:uncharacterized protein involved in high-affinity Fe2+ transport